MLRSAVALGLALGVATRLVYDLPSDWWWLARLGVPWLAAAFAIGAMSRRPFVGAARGAIALVTAVLVYYAILAWLQHAYEATPVGVGWAAIAIPGGAAFGALGSLWRSGRAPVLACSVLAASFAGEALLVSLAGWAGGVVAAALLAVAAGLPVVLLRGRAERARALLLASGFAALALPAEVAVFLLTGYVS